MGKLISKKFISRKIFNLYDLEVQDNHNYFTDGILTHNCGPTASQSKNLCKLKVTYKIGLTGSLIVNSPISAFIPLRFIGVDNATLTNFKKQYCEFGGFGGHQIVGYKNLNILKNEIESCALIKTMDVVKLPPKNIITEYVEMNDTQSSFYEAVKNGVKEECDKIELNDANILALTTRLRQATSCPSVLTTENIESSKINRAVELVEEITSRGDKVVIMSNFKEPMRKLKELLKNYNPLLGTGDVSDGEFSNNVDLFQNDPKYKVFLGTSQKAGTGLTLNAATYMIMIDEAFTAAQNEQVIDRIYRVNNTKPVFIYNLITENTVDERIHEIVETKKDLSDFIVYNKQDIGLTNRLRKIIQDL